VKVNSKSKNKKRSEFMVKTLVVTEKLSVAQTIAAVLDAKKRGDGFIEGSGWLISWCFGHLVELAPADAYGEQYKRWSYDTLPILPDVWKYRASDGKKKQLDILRSLMNRADVDTVVCATDAGREGQLIFQLVYDQCKCKKPVQRLWISSLEDTAVREGFRKLRPGVDYDNLYRAALCRAQADYVVGINTTRLFSCLYGTTLNVGRVQSPTLALIVGREEAVRSFVSEPFYTPEIDCVEFTASGEKHKDFDTVEAVRAAAVIKDSGVSDHHAITPTLAASSADLSTLPSGERDILSMIAALLICAVGDKDSYETDTAVMECG